MSIERIDAETLAAFIDGSLDPVERGRVLGIIAAHPEEYEAFADAAHVAAELESAGVVPIRRRARVQPWLVAVPALIAAGIAAVVVLPKLRGGGGTSPMELAEQLALVPSQGRGSLSARLGDNWDQPGWSITRGGESEVTETAKAFRLGARATDVEIALRARDSAALPLVGAEVIGLVSSVDGGAPLAAQYRMIMASGAAAAPGDRMEAQNNLRSLVGDSLWFDLGAWSEAVRVAALAEDTRFLSTAKATLDALITRLGARPDPETTRVTTLLVDLRNSLAAAASGQLNSVKTITARLMATAGR
jgi:hypothetical protein